MSTFTTLPTGPHEHLALDYARLREEGLRLLGRLAGAQWTDFNVHDPGVTILEQLCYAITDLAYRIEHPMADLLAGGEAALALHSPASAMSCDPVTQSDLRKLVLDVDGVLGAWAEPPGEPELPLFYHQGSEELRFQAEASDVDARPVQIRGLHQVRVTTHDADRAFAAIASRLHARRALCEDFTLASFNQHPVWIRARIEVGPVEDPGAVMADVLAQIAAYLESPVRFTTEADARTGGSRSEELFDGPALDHGFVLEELPRLRRSVRVSDLIHAIMDVSGVRAVPLLELASSSGGPWERWMLAIPAGYTAILAPASEIRLLRAGLALRVAVEDGLERLEERRLAGQAAVRPIGEHGEATRAGRDRNIGRYRSIQHDLPAAFGVGALGLTGAAPAERRAQALQLKAYLLLFDQLLANAFSQLAHAGGLLSPGMDRPGSRPQTYFEQAIADPALGLDEVLGGSGLESQESESAAIERRNRFLGHLLARFAEQVGDHAADRSALLDDRRAFLRDVARIGRSRGCGYDLIDEGGGPSGFEQRLRLKLGLREQPRFHVVEHILLRPVPEDDGQLGGAEDEPQVPLLAGVAESDPWSLQISLVFAARQDGQKDDAFEQWVAQTILAETPAHLRPRLHWIDPVAGEDPWREFETAWLDFKAAYGAYRRARSRSGSTRVADEIHIRARAARDRVIDLLGFGRTYPLRDLPVVDRVFVGPGKPATISIGWSQVDVVYGLYDRETGAPLEVGGQPVEARGDGGTLELVTPPIVEDFTCRIQAVKIDGRGSERARAVWLRGMVRVEEGIDPSLVARIRRPLLDPGIVDPRPSDARIVDYGATVEVEVLVSQEGVEYTLVDDAEHDTVLSQDTVIGTSGTIVLRSRVILEDVDLRVHCVKAVGDPQNPSKQVGLLALVLPLRVRANPAVGAALVSAIVEHGAGTVLRLEGTQRSVDYRVWRRRLRDAEFVFVAPPPAATMEVVDGERTIRVTRPPAPHVWEDIPGFEPQGEARAGTGGVLELPIAASVEDALLLVQASKRHAMGPLAQEVETQFRASAVQLDRALALLVRPDRRRALRAQVSVSGDATTGPLLLAEGQPGVFYELYAGDPSAPVGLEGYFHQRDDQDAHVNKGVGQLRVEVDFALARGSGSGEGERAAAPPPLVEIEALPLGTELRVVARKAMSGLEAEFVDSITIAPVPAIRVAPEIVAAGASARIVIEASVPGERYRLLRRDEIVGEAEGTGDTLELGTGPLAETVMFQLSVERGDAASIVVSRRLELTVEVQPQG